MFPGSPHLQSITNGHTAWPAFRRTLTPRFRVVWRDIILCYGMLGIGLFTCVVVTKTTGLIGDVLTVIVCSIWCGYWLHALLLFGHEAAHGNIAPKYNDPIANWTIWLPFGLTTERYRRTHWEHHIHLGDHDDTEHSYHNCMHPWFLLQLVTGIYFIKILGEYHGKSLSKQAGKTGAILRTAIFHGITIGTLWWFGSFATIMMWLLGTFAFFPLFATVRQILEHRHVEADCERDFAKEEHRPVNRMFGTDLFSRYFGAAGFNRHLLHHWDPTVSYTRFDDMERFLLETPLRHQLQATRSTYRKTFTDMLRSALHG